MRPTVAHGGYSQEYFKQETQDDFKQDKVHANAPQSMQELKGGIRKVIEDINSKICEFIFEHFCKR